MKTRATRKADSVTLRCLDCGHPRNEHHARRVCTVPKCVCVDYREPTRPAA